MSRTAILSLLAGLAALCGFPRAEATVLGADTATPGTVLFNGPVMVENEIDYAGTTPLAAPGSGELYVTLADGNFPTFVSLQFALANTAGPLDPLGNAGLQTLDLTAPATIYVDVFGTTQAGDGLYTIDATFVGNSTSAVPLQSSGTSLAAGLAVLLLGLYGGLRSDQRAGTHATVTTAVA